MEIVEEFDEESYNDNGKPWKSSRTLRVNPFFHFSSSFSSFFSISSFFHFFFEFIFSFFSFFLFNFSFFLFIQFFMFFHVSFILFFFVGCSKSVFSLGLNFVTISLDSS